MPKSLNDMWPGKRFGKLVLLERCKHPSPKRPELCWRVQCDCGNQSIVFPNALRRGTTASCGCGLREHYARQKAQSNTALTRVRNTYQCSAKKRGIYWGIDNEIFERIIQDPCTYCGALPSNKTHNRRGDAIVYSGIDRLDNSLGYIPGNVKPCCRQCNNAKATYSYERFVSWAERVAKKATRG